MSIENRVFEKLFSSDKTELASQKIELVSIGEIEKVLKKVNDGFNDISIYNDRNAANIGQFLTLKNKAKSDLETAKKSGDKKLLNDAAIALDMITVFQNKFSELYSIISKASKSGKAIG